MQPVRLILGPLCAAVAGAALFAGCSASSTFTPAARGLAAPADSQSASDAFAPAPDAFVPPKGACKSVVDTIKSTADTVALPATAGFSGHISLPPNDGASKAKFEIELCPGGDPLPIVAHTVIPRFLGLVGGTPVVFVQLSPLAHALTFTKTLSAFLIDLPAAAFPPHGAKTAYYVGGCDEAHCNVAGPVDLSIPDVVGPIPLSKTTLSLGSTNALLKDEPPLPSLTVPAGHTELAFIYASPYPPQVQYRRVRLAGSR